MGARMEGDTVLAWAVGGPYGEGYSFQFAAPPGETLEPRNYIGAQRLPFRDAGHPGLEVVGQNRGCNTIGGRFELRDLVRDGAGNIRRLWVIFQQHREGSQAAAWGEVRIDAPAPAGPSETAPGTVRWPPLDAWRRATPAPVTYRGAAPLASASIAGPHPGDFAVDAGGCLGRAGPCDVLVRFAPRAAGTRTATLRLTDATGATYDTALEGFFHGGTTSATIEVLPGDVAGQPGTYAYGPDQAQFGGQTHDTETTPFPSGAAGPRVEGRVGAGGGAPPAPRPHRAPA